MAPRRAHTAPHLRRRGVAATVTSLSVIALALSVPSVARAAAPAAASLIGPADGSAVSGSSANLAVAVSDPDGDDVEVSLQGRVQGATTAGAGDPFTIVAIPDIQNYTYAGRPATIVTQANWAVSTRAELSTAFVVELGDLVSAYESTKQWGNASRGLAPLDVAGIPNSVVPGNHDFDNTTGEAPLYNTYFPPSRYSSASWTPSTARYGGYLGQSQFGADPVDRRNMDSYSLFTAGGQDFLVLNLEWEAPRYALDWADRVLSAHPDRTVIMVTHSFINVSGGRRTNPQRPGGTSQSALWSSFVATHCQIRLVLSGHESNATDGEASRTDPNNCGEPVHQVLTDYQSRPNGGDGWLRYYTFDPTAGTMRATTYSPLLDQYETDADSSFTLPFDLGASEPAPFTTVATMTVPSGSTATATWGQLAADTTYEWRAVVSDGTTQTTSPTWTFHTTQPPANVPPVAVIAQPVVDGLSVALTSTGSRDPDGTLQAWRWTFGDGAGQDGPSASHAYAAGGSYEVHLTVTDDDGASTTTSTTVTVSAPPPPQDSVARDAFERTATGSWGAADAGGSWTLGGSASRYSIANGAATQRVSVKGTSADSYLTSAVATASELRVNVSWDRTAAAGAIYTSIVPRTISGSTDYRLKIYIAGSGQPALQLIRRVGGAESILATTKLSMTVAAGDWYSVAVRTAPAGGGTRLDARFWRRGTVEPTGWQVTATDSTATLQGSGYPKLSSYLSGSANAPIATSYDDLLVTGP